MKNDKNNYLKLIENIKEQYQAEGKEPPSAEVLRRAFIQEFQEFKRKLEEASKCKEQQQPS